MWLSHMFSPDGPNNTLLSRGCVLEMALAMATVCVMCVPDSIQGQRRGKEPPVSWVQLLGQPEDVSSRGPPPKTAKAMPRMVCKKLTHEDWFHPLITWGWRGGSTSITLTQGNSTPIFSNF